MNSHLRFKSKKIDVTPDFPSRLTGMGLEDRSIGVHSSLEINAMVLNQNNKNIFIISIDTLFLSKEIKTFITEQINQKFGITEEQNIIITSTHTHYAPSLEDRRIKLGAKDERYSDFLLQKTAKLIHEIKDSSYNEIVLKISEGKTRNLTSSRRRKARVIKDYFNPLIVMEPNIKGFKNEKIQRINIYDIKDNTTLGVIWSFPCHLTNYPNKNMISSEFPGKIRSVIRKNNKEEGMPVIYLPGLAGDVRAYPPRKFSIFKTLRNIFQLSYPTSYYRFSNEMEYNKWVDDISNACSEINKGYQVIGHENKLNASILKEPLTLIGIEAEGIKDLIFRKISIGNELAIYFMSAEPVAYYSEILESVVSEKNIIYTGYSDEVFGYLPTEKQIKEGGYESKGHFETFLIKGDFLNQIEKVIKLCIQKMNACI